MSGSLRSKTIANLSYNALTKLITFLVSSAGGIILTRHLSADDYGIVGFATIFILFLDQFGDLGITPSLIQKEKLEERELYTAFTLKLLLSVLILAMSLAWGALSQKLLGNPAVKAVVIVLTATLFIEAIGFLPTVLLKRELKFKLLAIPQIGSKLVSTTVAITAVYLGFRYWSLVLANLSAVIVTVAIVYALRPVPFKLRFAPKAAREYLKFGSSLFLAGLLAFLLGNADNFITGAVGGAAALGYYAIAFNWSTKASALIGNSIHDVLLSTFSRVQNDRERLKRGYLTIIEYVSFAAILANGLLLIIAKEFLILVLGGGTDKWLPALYAMEILCICGTITAILTPVRSLIIAAGKPDLILKTNSIVSTLQVTLLYPSLKYFGIEGVATVVTLACALQFLIYSAILRREMSIRLTSVLRCVRPAAVSGCVLAALGLTLNRLAGVCWPSIILKLVLGTLVYIIIYGFITRWKILRNAIEILSKASIFAI